MLHSTYLLSDSDINFKEHYNQNINIYKYLDISSKRTAGYYSGNSIVQIKIFRLLGI